MRYSSLELCWKQVERVLGNILCHPILGHAVGKLYQDRLRHRGVWLDLKGIDPFIKAQLWWGKYELIEISFVQRYLRRDLDVVELGSSLGIVSAHIAARLGPGRRLVCIEANPYLLHHIPANVYLNRPDLALSVVHAAVYYGAPTVDLTLEQDTTASRVSESANGRSVTVPALPLGRLLSAHDIGDYVLVCDIEGAEAGIIECDSQALSACRQMLIELHDTHWDGRPYSIEAMAATLKDRHGFHLRAYDGPVCLFER